MAVELAPEDAAECRLLEHHRAERDCHEGGPDRAGERDVIPRVEERPPGRGQDDPDGDGARHKDACRQSSGEARREPVRREPQLLPRQAPGSGDEDQGEGAEGSGDEVGPRRAEVHPDVGGDRDNDDHGDGDELAGHRSSCTPGSSSSASSIRTVGAARPRRVSRRWRAAPVSTLTMTPMSTRSITICRVTSTRAASVTGAMSPKRTVANTVTVKYRASIRVRDWVKVPGSWADA